MIHPISGMELESWREGWIGAIRDERNVIRGAFS
jgi:hypothetical protein